MKWFLVWVVLSTNPDTGQVDWVVTQEAQDSFEQCVENLGTKNAEFEALRGTENEVDWQIFCARPDDINISSRISE